MVARMGKAVICRNAAAELFASWLCLVLSLYKWAGFD